MINKLKEIANYLNNLTESDRIIFIDELKNNIDFCLSCGYKYCGCNDGDDLDFLID